MNDVDWSTVLGGSSFVGLLAFLGRDLIQAWLKRRQVNADAGRSEAEREVTLSRATLEAYRELQDSYENRLRAIQADAQAQIAGARADAANAVASSMHEVATARGEVSQIRAEAAQMRSTVERIEQLLLWVRAEVWRPATPDLVVARVRERLGDGSAPLSALVNGSR